MMLNDIVTINSPSDMFSGTGRAQALKDGNFAGLGQFADDPEPQQKNFLSVLSKFGTGTVQVTSEESENANLKLAEGRLPDEVKADNASAGKPKGKQGKDGCIVRRVSSGYTETLGLVLGILSIPEPPQPDLTADPAFHALKLESEENPDSGLIAGGSTPVTTQNQHLTDASIILTGTPPQMPPLGLSGSDLAQTSQIEVSPKIPGQLQPDPSSIKDPAQVVQGAEAPEQQKATPDLVSVSGSVFSRSDSGQFFQGKQSQMLKGQLQPDPSSIKDPAQVVQGAEAPEQQKATPDLVSISGSVFSRSDSGQLFQGKQSQMLQGQRQADQPSIKGSTQVVQGAEAPEQQKATPDLVSVSGSVFSRSDSGQLFQGKQSQMLQGQRQADQSSIKGSTQVVQGRLVHKQQASPQRNSFSIPDTVHLEPLTGKGNPDAKGNIPQGNSVDNVFQDTSLRDQAPAVQKGDPAIRLQEVKAKSGLFHQTVDIVETDGISSPSASASNADSDGTMDAFMSAYSPGMITDSDDGPRLQPLEPVSADSVVNFATEGQMEKTSPVSLSSNETRPVNQPFHIEVVKQVVEKTAATLKSGQSEIQIDLKPESLGHLRLHVLMDNQQVTVKILAENTQVKEMIERQAYLIKNELLHQGIKVDAVNVDMLMSGGSDFASSQHEQTAFKQTRNEPAYGGGRESPGQRQIKEPDSPGQANSRGGSLVNYFA